MRARYPGPVGGDNPVSPVELLDPGPRLGQFVWPGRWQVS
jgi:hypothetical protein